MCARQVEGIARGVLHLVAGEDDLVEVVLPVAHGQVGVDQVFPHPVRGDGIQRDMDAGIVDPVMGELADGGQLQGTDHFPFGQGEFRREGAAFRQGQRFVVRPFHDGFHQRVLRSDVRRLEPFSRVAFRRGEGQDADVLVVAPGLVGGLPLRQLEHDVAFFHLVGTGPDEHPHGVLGLDPRTAGHRPARAGLDGEAQSEAVGLAGQVAYHVLPGGGEGADLRAGLRPGAAEIAVEPLDS